MIGLEYKDTKNQRADEQSQTYAMQSLSQSIGRLP